MKVVLFCGGLGMRIRDHAEEIPKPMVTIGNRPILWHLMKYYAHFGHKDFILCLGHKGDAIKTYFINYNEYLSNDFILTDGCRNIQLLNSDLDDWRITFVDTGLNSNIGQRLKAIEDYLDGEEVFLANYADGLTDLPLPNLINHFYQNDKIANFLSVKPIQSFHVVTLNNDNQVQKINHVTDHGILINGGFFIFKKDIFNYLNPGDDLVAEPFQRLIKEKQLISYKYDGFWACMDTFKERQDLEEMYCRGDAPWAVWNDSQECHAPNRLSR